MARRWRTRRVLKWVGTVLSALILVAMCAMLFRSYHYSLKGAFFTLHAGVFMADIDDGNPSKR